MDYAIRILLEEKVNIEEELKITDKQERREPQERRLISIANALNRLNIDDVSKCECGETKDLITVCDDCCTQLCQAGM